jgi:hypothetical protein
MALRKANKKAVVYQTNSLFSPTWEEKIPRGYGVRQQGIYWYAVRFVNGRDGKEGWRELATGDAGNVPEMTKKPHELVALMLTHQQQYRREKALLSR